ncbi:unnamed protein product, partial [Choristocarpus tenellus]
MARSRSGFSSSKIGKVYTYTPLRTPPNPHCHRIRVTVRRWCSLKLCPALGSSPTGCDSMGKSGFHQSWTLWSLSTPANIPKVNKVLVPATVDRKRYKKLMIEDVIPPIK